MTSCWVKFLKKRFAGDEQRTASEEDEKEVKDEEKEEEVEEDNVDTVFSSSSVAIANNKGLADVEDQITVVQKKTKK